MADKTFKSASQTINFGSKFTVSPSLELDEKYNKSYYKKKEAKTIFDYTESAFLKAMPGKTADIKYEIETSAGTATTQDLGVSEDFTDNLTFTNTDTAELKYPPNGVVSFTWKGKPAVTLSNKGQTVTATVPEVSNGGTEDSETAKPKILGIAICKYVVLFDRLKLAWTDEVPADNTQVVVMTEYNNADKSTASCEVEFTNFGYRDVELIIKNIATDKVVSEASVVITNTLDATDTQTVESDDEGKVVFEKLKVGQEYTIKVTHEDYIATDLDYLNNDFFTVPAVEQEETT